MTALPFDLHRLFLLRELAHRGTITAVAEALSYSPSAVSQQLKVLEGEVGLRLVEPVGRRVRLTPPARRLVEHTETVLQTLEGARSELAAAGSSITGTVRVAAFQTVAHTLLPPALTALAAACPRLRVELVEDEPETALPALVAREFDLVIVEEYPGFRHRRRPEAEYRRLLTDRLDLAQPRGWPVGRRAGLAGLSRRMWIMEPAPSLARDWATALCRAAGFEPDVRYETSDLLLHAQLVRTGHAVAILPRLLALADDPDLRLLPLPQAPARAVYTVARTGAGDHPAVRAVRDALAAALPAQVAP